MTRYGPSQRKSIYIHKRQAKNIDLENNTYNLLIIIEIQTGNILDESDILRFRDDYKRNN